MLGRTVVAVHKADLIGLVERMDIDMGMVIEMVNKVCVFDHKHPLRTAAVDKQVGQAQVIGTGELFLRIGAELAVVRGIEKYKIVGRRLVQIKKGLKVKTFYNGVGHTPLHLARAVVVELAPERFAVVSHPPVRDIKLASGIISEHAAVAVIAYEQKESCRERGIGFCDGLVVIQRPEVHVYGTFDGRTDIFPDVSV